MTDSKAGKKTNVDKRLIPKASMRRTPMLNVPGCAEIQILPKDPIVVSALNNIARGVEV